MVEKLRHSLSQANLYQAKIFLYAAVNKKNIEHIVKVINHGFPIDEPLMDCGINLLMHAAARC